MNPWASFSSSPLFIFMSSVAFNIGFVPSSVLLSKAREPQALWIHRTLCILELERNCWKMEIICGSGCLSVWLIFFGFPITTSTLLVSPSSLPFGSKISKHGDKNCTGNQQLGTCSVNFKCWCISVLAKNSNETNNNNNNNNKMFNANHLPLTLFQNRNIYSIVQCSWLLAPCGDFWLRYHLETIWLIHLMYFWQIFSLIPSLLRNYDRWASATDIIC